MSIPPDGRGIDFTTKEFEQQDMKYDSTHRDRCRIAQISLQDNPYEGIGHNSTYGQMFTTALRKHGQLCIGLYRLHDSDNPDAVKRYVITNPPAELRIRVSDYVYVLEQFDPGMEYEPGKRIY